MGKARSSRAPHASKGSLSSDPLGKKSKSTSSSQMGPTPSTSAMSTDLHAIYAEVTAMRNQLAEEREKWTPPPIQAKEKRSNKTKQTRQASLAQGSPPVQKTAKSPRRSPRILIKQQHEANTQQSSSSESSDSESQHSTPSKELSHSAGSKSASGESDPGSSSDLSGQQHAHRSQHRSRSSMSSPSHDQTDFDDKISRHNDRRYRRKQSHRHVTHGRKRSRSASIDDRSNSEAKTHRFRHHSRKHKRRSRRSRSPSYYKSEHSYVHDMYSDSDSSNTKNDNKALISFGSIIGSHITHKLKKKILQDKFVDVIPSPTSPAT